MACKEIYEKSDLATFSSKEQFDKVRKRLWIQISTVRFVLKQKLARRIHCAAKFDKLNIKSPKMYMFHVKLRSRNSNIWTLICRFRKIEKPPTLYGLDWMIVWAQVTKSLGCNCTFDVQILNFTNYHSMGSHLSFPYWKCLQATSDLPTLASPISIISFDNQIRVLIWIAFILMDLPVIGLTLFVRALVDTFALTNHLVVSFFQFFLKFTFGSWLQIIPSFQCTIQRNNALILAAKTNIFSIHRIMMNARALWLGTNVFIQYVANGEALTMK